ncbi:imidazolonepropionase-like domain-containing protein [Kitasatospora sp. NPDC090091]|uniref:amidohydrolase family protein n=1 Tax=Kitasatospora sp. NPDC090091 TaxID=3364081 RepID=UPI0037F64A1E
MTLHRAALVLPDPADPTAPSVADGAVLVQDGRIAALGPCDELAAAHPGARLRDWGAALLTPGLRNPYGHRLLEHAYHPDPREGVGDAPVPGALSGSTDETRCGASARRGLQRMLGCGVTAVAGPFERASVRTAVTRSGLTALAAHPGAAEAEGPLDPLAVLPLAEAAYGRLAVGGRADFAVFEVFAVNAVAGGTAVLGGGAGAVGSVAGEAGAVGSAAGEAGAAETVVVRPGSCLATVLAGRLVYRRR